MHKSRFWGSSISKPKGHGVHDLCVKFHTLITKCSILCLNSSTTSIAFLYIQIQASSYKYVIGGGVPPLTNHITGFCTTSSSLFSLFIISCITNSLHGLL